MPEMKLKQQNLIYNFKSVIKSLETKLNILDKLESNLNDLKLSQKYNDNFIKIRDDIERVGFFCNNSIHY